MTGLLVLAAVAYLASAARGIRRSKRSGNIMASTFRRPHSWRWWAWTACCRPGLWTEGLPTRRAGVWVGRARVPLPVGLFPAHMRRPIDDQLIVEAKQGYVRGFYDLPGLEDRIEKILTTHWQVHP